MGLRDKLRAICHEVRMRPLQGDPTQIGTLRIRISKLPSPEVILTMPEPELKQLRALTDRLIYDLDRFESNRSVAEAQRYQHRTGLPPRRRPLIANWYQQAMLKEASESDEAWDKRLKDEAYAKGAHIPHSWTTEYDDGSDGCMPEGWYLIGLDSNGLPITWPQRHEYGPFKSSEEALAFKDQTQLKKEASGSMTPAQAQRLLDRNTDGYVPTNDEINKAWSTWLGLQEKAHPGSTGGIDFYPNVGHWDVIRDIAGRSEDTPVLVFYGGRYWRVAQTIDNEFLLEPLRDDGTGVRVDRMRCRVVKDPELTKQLKAIQQETLEA